LRNQRGGFLQARASSVTSNADIAILASGLAGFMTFLAELMQRRL
jgi:hypothetical protein